jgi:hypothetical protein
VSKDLLRDPDTSAVVLMACLPPLLGDFLAWEPESIWLECERQGVDLPEPNRAKIMAAVALHLIPSFYWDGIVFEKTAIAFDGTVPNPEIIEEASPARLAWAVVEAAWILERAKQPPREFESEPRVYAGIIMARAGYMLAPEQLAFAQDVLDRHRPVKNGVYEGVRARWARIDKNGLEKLSLDESPVDVQIARLASVELHVRERRARAERDLARIA